ncbi:MAG: hypothetical protein RIQ99_1574 [Pseudomonadota bacterium]|jgi:CubicO group peptidase (beta-lactamase class C family)
MHSRCLPLILPLLALPALIGCSAATAPAPPPLPAAAMAAVALHPGVNREQLARAVDTLFTDPQTAETRAVLVLHNGQIVAERYAPGYHQNTRFISWSMAKSVTGVMIGMLVADGRLRLDESVPIPAWQRPGDPRGEITLRELLQMRSGLRHTEAEGAPYRTDTARMLFLDGRDDMAAYAEAQPLEDEPGRRWEYSTATSLILSDLAARVLIANPDPAANSPQERRRVVSEFLRARMFEPLGMASMVPEFDRAGTLLGGSMIHGTARDWAKFGEFLRNDGAVRGAQLVPPSWIEFMASASPANPGYGAQLWLNHPQRWDGHIEFPGAPRSTFSMNGHLGQFVVVSKANGVTVVRLGKTDEGKHAPIRQTIARIIQLFPQH